jgi:isocitrate dehydrogenase (NAD+)
MAHNVTLIRGDGTGPELMEAARRVLEATGVTFNWDVQDAGVEVMEQAGTPLPDSVLESIRRTRVAYKAPITTPIGTGFRSVNVAIRKEFDQYANVRPAKWYPGVRSKYQNINLILFRENTEDLYAGIEFEMGKPETKELIGWIRSKQPKAKIYDDAGISIKPISITGTRRLAKFAFEYARRHRRKKMTAVAKANIMKYTDGLFYEVCRDVAKMYPDIVYEEMLVDNMCMQLVQKPELYDCLLCPNLYGDILSDLCAGLVGGLGVAPGANIGDNGAMFEAVHGSAPKYKGMNKVNPTALILAGKMMLEYLGEEAAAQRLEKAVAAVIAEGKHVTYDMKADRNDPTAVGTKEMADAIIAKLKSA